MICFKYIVVNTCIKVNNNKKIIQYFVVYVLTQQTLGQLTETTQVQKAVTKIQSTNEITYTRGNKILHLRITA
jgi:hypothetical protein